MTRARRRFESNWIAILVGRVDAFRASTRFAPTFGVTMSTV
jgi:hypothetical protein